MEHHMSSIDYFMCRLALFLLEWGPTAYWQRSTLSKERLLPNSCDRLPQVEIALWETDATAFFGDEGVLVAELPARIVHLAAGARCDPHGGNACMVESSGELIESRADYCLYLGIGLM